MNNKRKAMTFVVASIITATSVLVLSTQAFSQQPPKPDRAFPTPNAEQLAQYEQIKSHYGTSTPLPPASGDVNGFTFSKGAIPDSGGCTGQQLLRYAVQPADPRVATSGLGFDVTYMPSGFSQSNLKSAFSDESGPLGVIHCRGSVLSTFQRIVSGSRLVEIRREPGMAAIGVEIAQDRLKETTINGRQALTAAPVYDGQPAFVFLRDEGSLWTITSTTVGIDELVKIAEGLR